MDILGSHISDKSKKIKIVSENPQSVDLLKKVKKMAKENKNKKFVCIHSDGREYDFNEFRDLY